MPIYRDIREGEDGVFITCGCGCGDTVKLELDMSECDYPKEIFFMSYYNANWGRDQVGAFGVFKEKIRKIWRIIRNKDHHYSDIRMSREEFIVFKAYVDDVYERMFECEDDKEDLA